MIFRKGPVGEPKLGGSFWTQRWPTILGVTVATWALLGGLLVVLL
jgi:hypothetical protein